MGRNLVSGPGCDFCGVSSVTYPMMPIFKRLFTTWHLFRLCNTFLGTISLPSSPLHWPPCYPRHQQFESFQHLQPILDSWPGEGVDHQTQLIFILVFFQHTSTKDMAGQSATERCNHLSEENLSPHFWCQNFLSRILKYCAWFYNSIKILKSAKDWRREVPYF